MFLWGKYGVELSSREDLSAFCLGWALQANTLFFYSQETFQPFFTDHPHTPDTNSHTHMHTKKVRERVAESAFASFAALCRSSIILV